MDDGVDGERQFEPDDFLGQLALADKGAIVTCDVVRRRCGAVLDRYLDVVKAGVLELRKSLRRDADAGCDEIGIETGLPRRRRDLDQIASCTGLAAGEM